MAGAILERELGAAQSGRVTFDVARESDDAEIRRLLRENPMPGRISISLEREPSFFADAEEKQTIVARAQGRVAGVGYCTRSERFVNGRPAQVGYLGGLRLDARYGGRFDVLRRGYEFLRELESNNPADFYFTTIASDNQRARRFLEAGIHGMPKYEFVGEFVTVVVPTGGKVRISEPGNQGAESQSGGEPPHSPAVAGLPRSRDRLAVHACDARSLWDGIEFVNERNRSQQFAPCWSNTGIPALSHLGLKASDFSAVSDARRIVAVGALWDQRCFKQTVVRGYTVPLALGRPMFNLFAPLFKQPRLPAVGEMLASALVSHLAVDHSRTDALLTLIGQLRAVAQERGIELLTLGFAASDPSLKIIRCGFGGREYRSRIYVVRWPGIGKPAGELDCRLAGPEVALL